jgi:hypothetical protein
MGEVHVLRMRKMMVATVVAVVSGAGVVAGQGSAAAAAGDIGYMDQSFSGLQAPPTADKPESKLWYTPDGVWWADMYDQVSKSWHIFRLNRTTEQWVDTGVALDDRANTSADTMWDAKAQKLYVASHGVGESSESNIRVSVAGRPSRLYRYSYNAGNWTIDAGFPADINNNSSESLTMDRDSTGTLWATWTQVSGDATTGYKNTLYVNNTTGSDSSWGTPFTPAVAGVNPHPDDISAVVAFNNKVGVLWSNNLDGAMYWAVHTDGAARDSWTGSSALRGSGLADDHLNIKTLQSDAAGRVFAVVKTGLDRTGTAKQSDPQVVLLTKPSAGSWTSSTFGTLADCHTRPQLVLDETNKTVHVVATAPTDAGCGFSGASGTIYEKVAPMDNPVFPPGRGTAIIRDAASADMNNATTTKQSVNASTGLVVLASNLTTQRYWHADEALGGTSPTSSSTLTGGQRLTAGQQLVSPNGSYRLVMQGDGNVVVYGPTGAIWNSGTRVAGTSLTMQSDGNLVAYGPDGRPVWNSGTFGNTGARVVMQDDGNLVIYRANGTAAWASKTAAAPASSSGDTLASGQRLASGQQLVSPNGAYRLVMQGDGNLVDYGPAGAIWNTGTRVAGTSLLMQTDGNLVAYAPDGRPVWNSGTFGNSGARLVMQNDGNPVIYAANGRALWSRFGRTY